MLGMTNTFCWGGIPMKNKFEENERRQSLFLRVKRTDLELALQFLLDPLSDVSEGDLPVPEHGTHVKV